MKTLKNIILESKQNDEIIDNTCVNEFIKYLLYNKKYNCS